MILSMPNLLKKSLLVPLLALATLLSGCGVMLVGGAATTAMVAADRRTAGEQVEDQAIEMKIGAEMRRLFGDRARVISVSYAGRVLLVGDVPTAQDKAQAETAAAGVENVKEIINRIRIGDITALSVRTNDTWISTKVRTALIEAKEVPARTIVVTTERGVVYLQGKVTETEGVLAAKVASNVSGVNEVVKLFTIVSRESLVSPAAPVSDASRSTTAQPASVTSGGSGTPDTQTMPVQ